MTETAAYFFAPEHELAWSSPRGDLWVATGSGDYRGLVERLPDGYGALSGRGEQLGTFDTIEQARAAVAASDFTAFEPRHPETV